LPEIPGVVGVGDGLASRYEEGLGLKTEEPGKIKLDWNWASAIPITLR
jgi:hypothetical protein